MNNDSTVAYRLYAKKNGNTADEQREKDKEWWRSGFPSGYPL